MISIQDLGSIATALSIVFIAWYTFEAYKTRENSIRPVLILFANKNRKYGDWVLKLKNIGMGATTAIKIQSFEIDDEKIKLIEELNYLSPNQETIVVFQYGKTNQDEKNFSKFPCFNDEFEIMINYADMEGKKYYSKILHTKTHRFRLLESKEQQVTANILSRHK